MTITSFHQAAQLVEETLTTEEAAGPAHGLADLALHRTRRASIEHALEALEASVARLRTRSHKLSPLPPEEGIRWAQAVRQLPNLAFLELDTDGLSSDADIIRVVLLDRGGTPLYEEFIHPRRPLSQQIMALTAVRPEEVQHAPTFAEAWPSLSAALQGRYILSFNLSFDLDKLRENAERARVEPVTVIGECLMRKAQQYVRQQSYPKLADLCRRIGSPLPDHPVQDAWDRARRQRQLLEAMSQGITFVQEPPASQADLSESNEDGDEPPF